MTVSQSKRINEILQQYWEGISAGRTFPMEQDFNPDEVDSIWDSCFLVRVEGEADNPTFRYVYLGESLVEAYGDDLTNKEICEKLVYPGSMALVQTFREILSKKTAQMQDSEFVNAHRQVIKFRACMCPLGKDNASQVAYIVGGMKWKAF